MSKIKDFFKQFDLMPDELTPTQLRQIAKYGLDISNDKVLKELIADYKNLINKAARDGQSSILITITSRNEEFKNELMDHFIGKNFSVKLIENIMKQGRQYIFIEW